MINITEIENKIKDIDELGSIGDFVIEFLMDHLASTHSVMILWDSKEDRAVFARWKGFSRFPAFLFERGVEKVGAVVAAIDCGCLVMDDYSDSPIRFRGEEFENIGTVVAYSVPLIGGLYLSLSCGRSKGAKSFDSEDVNDLMVFTNLVANRINSFIYQESVLRVQKGFFVILSGLEGMLRGEDEASILTAIVQDLLDIFDAQYVITFRYNPEEDILVPVFYHGFVEVLPLKPGEGVGGRAFKERRPVLIADIVFELPEHDRAREFYASLIGSVISVPYYLEGRCVGVLCIARARYKPPFTQSELFLLELIARLLEAILSYSKMRREERERSNVINRLQRLESLGLLAGGVAHDFNNILNGIMGLAEILKLKLTDEELKRIADMIVQQVKHGASLTKQLLDFARKSPAEMSPFDLVVFLKEFVNFIRRTFPSSIKIRTDITCKTAVILGDVNQINQALLNICINAKDAMPNGGELTIRLYKDEDRNEYVIEVIDTGIGMSKDVLERCLDPFFTTKKEFGTGLGLPQAYGIIEKHGGMLKIESEENIGTKVTIRLPAYVMAFDDRQRKNESSYLPRGDGELVLLVEDDEASLIIMKNMLELLGYRVIACRNGMEALQTSKVKKPDLVVTDIVMPEMDGITLANNLREIYKNMPIILISGYSMDKQANGFSLKGFYLLQKPISLKELAIKVKEALSGLRGAG